MLTLAYNRPINTEYYLQQFITDNAPILALNAIAASHGDITYAQLKTLFNDQLALWWDLPPHDNIQPADQYEACYWSLMQTLNNIDDYQLLGDLFIKHKVKSLSYYLLNSGPCPSLTSVNRP